MKFSNEDHENGKYNFANDDNSKDNIDKDQDEDGNNHEIKMIMMMMKKKSIQSMLKKKKKKTMKSMSTTMKMGKKIAMSPQVSVQ